MSVDPDPDRRFADYAAPDRLVSTGWLSAHLGHPDVRIVESDEDALLYGVGHIPGAVKIDWLSDLNDPVTRDYLDGERFAQLMRRKGIDREHTVVLYGDKNNWWAAYALWVFTLFGHADVRLLDGGRDAWFTENRDVSFDVPEPAPTDYPVVQRDDTTVRIFRDDVAAQLGRDALVDVRSGPEYTGERTHLPDHPMESALRGGHIPTAEHIPWARAIGIDGRFRPAAQLRETYGHLAGSPIVTYCRIGERSSHTWFVLTHLLGYPGVRNYDGSWTEWGNAVRMPIARGEQPGSAPRPAVESARRVT
ncbi:sulfurtransferase [Skermania piniformis]|uniref:Sulfurtransferase n=1 Tax=Skermania pinensis TaxID=39122 RepID=A0ABX8S8G8_9ACTN|nr:sulfurtransferase [Skermania piniformis]QXQ13294.1 sulfurtransferase [Skermania piniformis]